MSSVNFLSSNENSSFNKADLPTRHKKYQHLNSAYIKQTIHDNKIDEFFWTDVEAPPKRASALALLGSFVGVFSPVLLFAKKQHPELKLNSLKNLWKTLNIEYGLKEILITGCGGVLGGLAGGLADRKEGRKLDKIEEATFQLMNITFPAFLVAGAMKMCEKVKPLNNIPSKILFSTGSILAGAALAVNFSNKLDDKFFDKYLPDGERKFKKKDFVVHVDDFLGTLILAKIPFADKLHINKILPLIYTWSGYHVGEA